MRVQLESWWRDPVPGLSLGFPEQKVPGALRCQLVSAALGSRMDVSLLPAFDAVGEGASLRRGERKGSKGTGKHGPGHLTSSSSASSSYLPKH